jgi:hypothetical protein
MKQAEGKELNIYDISTSQEISAESSQESAVEKRVQEALDRAERAGEKIKGFTDTNLKDLNLADLQEAINAG